MKVIAIEVDLKEMFDGVIPKARAFTSGVRDLACSFGDSLGMTPHL